MNCKKYQDLIEKYVDGVISDTELADLKEHTQRCASCCAEFKQCNKAQSIIEEGLSPTATGEQARDSILSELTSQPELKATWSDKNLWRTIMKTRITKMAAAVVIIIAVLAGLNQLGDSNAAWAAAVERLNTARTMTYTVTMYRQLENVPSITIRMDVAFKKPGHIRVEVTEGSFVWIINQRLRKVLVVKPLKKEFTEIDIPPNVVLGFAQQPQIVEQLRTLPDQADEDLGEQNIDGRMLRGYRATEYGVTKILWIDPETMDLVRAEINVADTPGLRLVITDFQFDVELDESLFSLTPPEGYTREKTSRDASTDD